MNRRLLHRWAREEALPLPSRTHPQKQHLVVYTEDLTDLRQNACPEAFLSEIAISRQLPFYKLPSTG